MNTQQKEKKYDPDKRARIAYKAWVANGENAEDTLFTWWVFISGWNAAKKDGKKSE